MKHNNLTLVLCLALSSCATLSPTTTLPTKLAKHLGQANMIFDHTLANAADNKTTVWHNDAGNTSYQLFTGKVYVTQQGTPCRDYRLQVKQNYQRPWISQGSACRRATGTWQVNA